MPFFTIAKVLLRAVTAKPATRKYPVEKRQYFKATRGHIEIDIASCTLCTLCAKKCPTAAITVDRAGRTWAIDRLRCIQCSACVDACGKDSLVMDNQYSAAASEKTTESVTKPADPPKPKPVPEAPKD